MISHNATCISVPRFGDTLAMEKEHIDRAKVIREGILQLRDSL